MSKYLPIVVALLICLCPLDVFAATGSVDIVLPEEIEEATVYYEKIAEREELDLDETLAYPKENLEYDESVEGNSITNLEEGVYQIQVVGNDEYEFMPSVISIPAWDEEAQLMSYQVCIIPKYIRHVPEPITEPESEVPLDTIPQTGDANNGGIFVILGLFSLLIVIMSCHNRFKCVRMSK